MQGNVIYLRSPHYFRYVDLLHMYICALFTAQDSEQTGQQLHYKVQMLDRQNKSCASKCYIY